MCCAQSMFDRTAEKSFVKSFLNQEFVARLGTSWKIQTDYNTDMCAKSGKRMHSKTGTGALSITNRVHVTQDTKQGRSKVVPDPSGP